MGLDIPLVNGGGVGLQFDDNVGLFKPLLNVSQAELQHGGDVGVFAILVLGPGAAGAYSRR